ncbi:CocE/NonD family hydrolase [Streptomyces sp. NPDC059340]|uniref:CocE/NonD family hydrolase n=1 Tax=Streptomyces sp. NPDC059340 TaxID=3346806 RepID=UPI0036881723
MVSVLVTGCVGMPSGDRLGHHRARRGRRREERPGGRRRRAPRRTRRQGPQDAGHGHTSHTGTTRAQANWTDGATGMIGKSWDGSIANGVAATGVKGLRTIVPVSSISSWYHAYFSQGPWPAGSAPTPGSTPCTAASTTNSSATTTESTASRWPTSNAPPTTEPRTPSGRRSRRPPWPSAPSRASGRGAAACRAGPDHSARLESPARAGDPAARGGPAPAPCRADGRRRSRTGGGRHDAGLGLAPCQRADRGDARRHTGTEPHRAHCARAQGKVGIIDKV